MVGPFKTAPSVFTHMLVAVDKFTKWIEAKPIRSLDGNTARKFMRDIVVRYGIPHSIITDNGSNLSQGELEEYCREQGIRLDLASVAHLQSNGQVECSNGLILRGIRPRLEVPLHRAAGAWVEELPSVLWSLRTTPNRSTGYTPFFMVYGAEAILPSDILHDSPRVAAYIEEDADLVLRLRQKKSHKLAPPWEGPFVISKALLNEAYYLMDMRKPEDKPKGKKRKRRDSSSSEDEYEDSKRPWNIAQLRPFYT